MQHKTLRPTKRWSQWQIDYLLTHLEDQTSEQIAEGIKKTPTAVTMYVLRNRLFAGGAMARNLLHEIILKRLPDHGCFVPNHAFYAAVKMSQRRYWDVYRGLSKLKDEEYVRLLTYFGISLEEAFEMRQLSLFDNQEKQK